MKNLVLLHLESLNQLNYRINSELFPTLVKLEDRCIVLDNYYSTATSTLMVLGDLFYGGMEQYESCTSLSDVPRKYKYKSSLFDQLKERGYYTKLYVYPDGSDRDSAERRHLAGFNNKMELVRDYAEYLKQIENCVAHKPFALSVCNYISNLGFSQCVDTDQYGMETGYWEAGFRCMDRCCGDVLDILRKRGILNDTIIVLYGDHGDDYWTHGLHEGLTHATEPNQLLIHTPVLIWDGKRRNKAEHRKELVQTTDLKGIIEQLLQTKKEAVFSKREYIISRNEYAAQPMRNESFHKAYSASDGRHLLMVSNDGLEMYDIKMDPACGNNILRFYRLKEGVLKTDTRRTKNLRFHFMTYWNEKDRRILRNRFYELRDALYRETLHLYKAGGRTEDIMNDEMRFDILKKK